jgi:hypothetical protein
VLDAITEPVATVVSDLLPLPTPTPGSGDEDDGGDEDDDGLLDPVLCLPVLLGVLCPD